MTFIMGFDLDETLPHQVRFDFTVFYLDSLVIAVKTQTYDSLLILTQSTLLGVVNKLLHFFHESVGASLQMLYIHFDLEIL